ncbi:MAG: glycosyltransferase [Burkholderiaceae bacterium]
MPPRITFIVLAYNQRPYLRESVLSCFAQQGEPIEILLSDDGSSDGSFELMKELASRYEGPHRVRVRRNERNLGIGEHYNRAIADSTGRLLVTAAGDDISLPTRAQALAQAWDATARQADLIASHVLDMTEQGVDVGLTRVADLALWKKPEDWVRKRPYVIGASHAFTKRLHEHFGPFGEKLAYEDQVMALRACCLGGGITVDQPLVRYRRGGISHKANAAQTPRGFVEWSQKKHLRQQALYRQIEQDLLRAGRPDLWRGKVRRQLQRSELALAMIAAPDGRQRLALARQAWGAGWFWTWRCWLYFSHPAWAVAVQRLQARLKGR